MKTIAWICLIVTVACVVSSPVLDPDLWWHIVVGRWIIAHQAFPETDQWNLFAVGTPWRAYSWLFEVAVAPIDRHLGDHGLLVAQLLLLASVCAALCAAFRQLSGRWFTGTALGIVVTFAMTQHFSLRPQTVVWALEAAVIVIAFSIVDQGLSRTKLFALVVTMCAWANLHITTAIGLGIAGCIVLGAAPLPVAAVTLAAGFLGTLLTPYLGREWLIFFGALGEAQEFRAIVELQPPGLLEVPTLFMVLLGFLVTLAGARRGRRWPPLLAVGALVLVVAGLTFTTFLPMATVLLAGIVARSLREPARDDGADGAWDRLQEFLRQLESRWQRVPSAALAPALLVVAGFSLLQLWQQPVLESLLAADLVERVIDEDLPQPVLNDFGRGGYFMYRYAGADGVPRRLVPVDGRTNVMSRERLRQYMDMAAGAENWREFFDAVDPRTVVFQADSPLVTILQATGNWCLIGRTEGSAVATALLLRKDEFELRRPPARPPGRTGCP